MHVMKTKKVLYIVSNNFSHHIARTFLPQSFDFHHFTTHIYPSHYTPLSPLPYAALHYTTLHYITKYVGIFISSFLEANFEWLTSLYNYVSKLTHSIDWVNSYRNNIIRFKSMWLTIITLDILTSAGSKSHDRIHSTRFSVFAVLRFVSSCDV